MDKNINIIFDVEPLFLVVDIYFNRFIKDKIEQLSDTYVDINKTEEGLTKLHSSIKEHSQIIYDDFLSSQYVTRLKSFLTPDGVLLLIIDRLTEHCSNMLD